jgi:hypothetical protein
VDDASKGRHDKFLPFYDALDKYKREHYGITIPEMGGARDETTIEVTGLDEDVADEGEED